jgi:transcriptional regulator with XRE-family HTH domain
MEVPELRCDRFEGVVVLRPERQTLAIVADVGYICSMIPQELTEFRTRMGWSQAELGRRLELSPSRLADYETGFTRGRARRPAPIPKAVELACAWLEEHEGKKQPLADAAWLALLRSLAVSDGVIEGDSREAIYSPPRGL